MKNQIINSEDYMKEVEKVAFRTFDERSEKEKAKKEKISQEMALSAENLEDFLDNYSKGIVTYPSGQTRDIRAEIEYSDEVLSSFHENGYDKGAKLNKLMYNITFPVWRTVVFFTDIDTRDILLKIRNTRVNHLTKGFFFLLNELLQFSFKQTRFGTFLNDAREEAAKYGKVLLKVVGNDVKIVSWYKIRAYDWTCTEDRYVRKAEEIEMTFHAARKHFENHDDEVKEIIEKEIEFLKKCDKEFIYFLEFWDYHYIDDDYKWGNVLYLSHEYYADVYYRDKKLYTDHQLASKDEFTELDRGTSGLTESLDGDKVDKDPYVELDFMNPMKKICRFGFGVPALVKAVQDDMNEKSHLKRKGDFAAYKSIWLYKRADGGDIDKSLEMQMRQGVESGALISYGQDEDIQHMTIGAPMAQFFNDYSFLEQMAMKIVGVNQLTAQEEKASKSATQASIEAGREQTSFNYFVEQQGLAFRELLSMYAKSLLLNLKQSGLIMLAGDPKRIFEIRKFLFQIHYQENQKEIHKRFKRQTGENPWASDIDTIYKNELKNLDKQFGNGETPINLSKFRQSIIESLDLYFDFHVTKEALNDDRDREVWKFMFQQAQTNPRINQEKVGDKLILGITGTHDPDIWNSDEEVAAIQQRLAQAQLQQQEQAEGQAPQQESAEEGLTSDQGVL